MFKRMFTLLSVCALAAGSAAALRADDFDTARNARLAILAGPSNFDKTDTAIAAQLKTIASTAQGWMDSMETGSTRSELWSDLPFPASAPSTLSPHITSTYGRLRAMALAYATHGSSLENNSSLLAAIVDGCTWMNANEYSTTTSESGNWWDYEIGTPLALNDTMVLIYPQLTTAQVNAWVAAIQHFTATPSGGGANLMWTSEVVSLSGVLIKNATQVQKGISSAPRVIALVGDNDGFYADGSFIQHNYFAYNGGYGLGLIKDLVDFTTVYAGTQWALSSTTVNTESTRLFKSFQPFIYKGTMLDDVRGRDISRFTSTNHSDGRTVIATFLHAASFASAADAQSLRSAAKYWIQQDTTYANSTDGFDIRTILQVESLMNDNTIAPMSEPVGFHLYSNMDRIVHNRPGWGASVSMFSTRNEDYESINSENLRGRHTGDGMLYVYDADLNQYSNNFWPTVNSYYQQGTTVPANTSQSAGQLGLSPFVGGVPSWDGVYGLAAMELGPNSSVINAKKAWFFLDNQIFCLGAGISSQSSAEVRTVVANRQLSASGTNVITSPSGTSNASPVAEPGTWYSSSPLKYLHIAGNTPGSSYGIFFPAATVVQSIREARTHAWSEINTNANYVIYNTDYTSNYYYTTINHGVGPTAASYAYAILPNISPAALASYASSPEVTVLENSASAQAITDSKLGTTAAIFWQAATKTVGTGSGSITSDSQAAVFVANKTSSLEVAVTDPTQTNTGTVHISLGVAALNVIDSSPQVTVTQLSPTVQMDVAVSGLKGQPALARFNLSGPVPITVDDATNTGGSTVSSVGTWSSSTGTAGYYGTDYLHDGNTGKGSKTFTFTPKVLSAGSYDVQVWYTSATNRATNVPVTVNAADGAHSFVVDQTSGGGAWVTLGTYNFNAGTGGSVVISNTGTNGYVVADAIRLNPR